MCITYFSLLLAMVLCEVIEVNTLLSPPFRFVHSSKKDISMKPGRKHTIQQASDLQRIRPQKHCTSGFLCDGTEIVTGTKARTRNIAGSGPGPRAGTSFGPEPGQGQ